MPPPGWSIRGVGGRSASISLCVGLECVEYGWNIRAPDGWEGLNAVMDRVARGGHLAPTDHSLALRVAVLHGTWPIACMRGTRIPVHVILDNLAAGESAETILGEYPTLRAEHIRAALAFAAELAHERVVPIPA